ncbi:hypothetical protein [Paracraurococcus ruber]|uniref:Uncharacterized protein n=1 Tax=Paracraurococcus ruber TaxID=77675 RepID=A0ABS1CVT2_9PROT|nr:hypothetical protein [Paracraurococcus ruber]MBK1658067.1 hypothetical protein [Paracraurococcus ruber]TDG34193.1 hypothetical protein E2C05_00080 [Paracraurococcus ruber]
MITGHIMRNLWAWTAGGLAIAVLCVWGRMQFGNGHHFGDFASLAFMFAGTTMILISQRGLVRPEMDPDAA